MEVKVFYKKIKNIILRVKPNLEVSLSVPLHTSQEEIDWVLQKRQKWIQQRLEFFQNYQQPICKLESGEKIYFLGECYVLKFLECPKRKEMERNQMGRSQKGVSLEGQTLILQSTPSQKHKVLQAWYQAQAKEVFLPILQEWKERLGFEVQNVKIRMMKTRWGSCNPKRKLINLNLELVKKPKECIEYVILHELTHLKHYYHNQDFYDFMSAYMPDWKQRKQRLNQPLTY